MQENCLSCSKFRGLGLNLSEEQLTSKTLTIARVKMSSLGIVLIIPSSKLSL